MLESHYLAFLLSEASRDIILEQFPPKFERIVCDHVTIEYNLDSSAYLDLVKSFNGAWLQATGYACDDSLECLTISVNGENKRPDGSLFHVTLSLGTTRKTRESNQLLRSSPSILPIDFPLEADLKLLPKT